MIILIEVLLIFLLAVITITLIIDERNNRQRAKRSITIKTYWDGRNRRRVMRHNTMLDVNYSVNSHFKPSKSRDISTHGIGLILEEKLERGTLLTIEIKVNVLKDAIRAKARVMWCREAVEYESEGSKRLFHTGIKFSRFTDTDQERKLFDYIRTIEKDSAETYVRL